MPAQNPLFQEVYRQVERVTRPIRLRKTTIARLALLITGIIAAKSCILAQVATELDNLALTGASEKASIGRRLRRTLTDPRLDPETCYLPVLKDVIDWRSLQQAGRRLFLITDESSKRDLLHLLRISLAYWGSALPLAWELWEQNVRLPDGRYWEHLEAALQRVASLLPQGLEVIMLADRAYDIPGFVDRIAALGWHWIVRCKDQSSIRFRDRFGHDCSLALLVQQHVPRPGCRWKTTGWVWKDAGWRRVSVVVVWERGHEERLTLLSDLPARWKLVRFYGRRCWTEPGFRNSKSRGWHWEDCQVQGIAHHQRLLLGMAWATLLMLCLGVQVAQRDVSRLAHRVGRGARRRRRKPEHARESVFTLGLGRVRRWLYQTTTQAIRWWLPEADAMGWNDRWCHAQTRR